MKVSSLYKHGTGTLNEDSLLVNGTIFGVFDGATSLVGDTFEHGRTGGYIAAHTARDVFEQNDASLFELTERANRAVFSGMRARGVDTSQKERLWSTSAAVVRIRKDHFDWIQTGDSIILAIYKDHTHKVMVADCDHDLETLQMWKKVALTEGPKNIRQALEQQICKVRAQSNVTYGVINGEPEALDFIESGVEDLHSVKHILIFTDGLLIPSENPGARMNFNQLVDLFLAGGLDGIARYVHTLQRNDPDCFIYPRFKPHDDMAAVALSF